MLNKLAFANSLAVLTAALYVFFAIIALISTWRILSAIRCFLWRECGVTLSERSTLRRVSRDLGAHDWHVMGRGVRVGVAVQSAGEGILGRATRALRGWRRRR
jgi:hypothetical protein